HRDAAAHPRPCTRTRLNLSLDPTTEATTPRGRSHPAFRQPRRRPHHVTSLAQQEPLSRPPTSAEIAARAPTSTAYRRIRVATCPGARTPRGSLRDGGARVPRWRP